MFWGCSTGHKLLTENDAAKGKAQIFVDSKGRPPINSIVSTYGHGTEVNMGAQPSP